MSRRNCPILTLKFMCSYCAMTACVLTASGVWAQETPPASASAPEKVTVLEQVTVTADRQNVLDVQKAPIAISVVDTEALSRQGAQGYSDYLETLPSVVLRENGRGQNQFVIRGMSTGGFNHTDLQDRSLVSVYLDDTPISLQGNTPDLKIYDLERVEVIRGPQGTLYGASAMAGNIRFITVKPDTSGFYGSAETTLTTTKEGGTGYSVRGMANMSLGERTALRVNAYKGENPGYIDNIGLNKRDANSDATMQVRAALRLMPNEALTVDLSHTMARLRTDGEPTMWREFGSPVPFESNNTNVPEAYKDDFNLSNLTVSYDFEPLSLISSTSYVDRDFSRYSSGQYLIGKRNLGLDTVPYDSIVSRNNIDNTLQDFSQEIRLQSGGENRLRWVVGAFYERTKRTQLQDVPTDGWDQNAYEGAYYANGLVSTSPEIGAPHADTAFYGIQNIRDRQVAVFGEATLRLRPGLDLTLGARYFDWNQDYDLYFGGLLGAEFGSEGLPVGPLRRDGVAGKESGVNPRAALSYQANDNLLLFAEAGKGFRFGGVNQPIPATCGLQAPEIFGSDSAWTYQVGAKSTLFKDRLNLNLTGFLTRWSDVQTRQVIEQCSFFFLVNDGSIRNRGLELESWARLTDRLQLGLNASYTDATADGPIPNLGAKDGARAPGVPRFQGSATFDYTLPVSADDQFGQFNFRATYQYRGGFINDWIITPLTTTSLSNARLDLAVNYSSARPWQVGVFVQNLLDEQELYSVSGERRRRGQPGFQQQNIGPGRTTGVRFQYQF